MRHRELYEFFDYGRQRMSADLITHHHAPIIGDLSATKIEFMTRLKGLKEIVLVIPKFQSTFYFHTIGEPDATLPICREGQWMKYIEAWRSLTCRDTRTASKEIS